MIRYTNILIIFKIIFLLLIICIPISLKGEVYKQQREWQVGGLLAAFNDEISEVRKLALNRLSYVEALNKIPKNKIIEIVKLLEDKDQFVRYAAVSALGKMGGSAKEYIPQIMNLLEHEDQSVRKAIVSTLGKMGGSAKEYIPQISKLLEDEEWAVRKVAVSALGEMGGSAKEYIPQIAKLLEDEEWAVRYAAISALVEMGGSAKEYIPQIAKFLEHEEWAVCYAAVSALGKMGESAKEYIPQIAKFLEHEEWAVREAVVSALDKMGESAKEYMPQIVKFLEHEEWAVREAAVSALGKMGDSAKEYIPQIAKLLEDKDKRVQYHAVSALGEMGEGAKEYMPQIINLLEHEDQSIRKAAVSALGEMGESAKEYMPQIAKFLEHEEWAVREAAVSALGEMGESAKEYIKQIAKLLKDKGPFVRKAAVSALGKMGEGAKEYITQIVKLLEDKDPSVRGAAVSALEHINYISIQNLPAIINPIYNNVSRCGSLRFLAHFLGAGKEDIEILLKWIGEPRNNYPKKLSHDEAIRVLKVFSEVWESTLPYPKVRSDLEKQIAIVVSKRNIKWKKDDIPFLEVHLKNLDSVKSTHADNLRKVIDSVKTRSFVSKICKISFKFFIIHSLFWLSLIFLYPESLQIQAIFFWNPKVRKIIGLGYVNFALTWIPYLRRKLFEPFRESLLADASLGDFEEESYFKDSEVISKNSEHRLPIREAIPKIKGQIILEGESGLGKSMFIRSLIKNSKELSVYLPAEKCSKGIMEAIQAKLHGVAKDRNFLQNLIYSGAIDICIDGLNEISPVICANLINFMESYFKGNIIMITQPIEWSPPKIAKHFVLQPLRHDQIKDFLLSRSKLFSKDNGGSISEYEEKCIKYLGKALNESQEKEVLNSIQRILSNLMDLTTIAQMLVHGKEPNLLQLQDQQYKIMAKDYGLKHIKPFPLKGFSESVYQMRLNDKFEIPENEFIDELKCMERYRMVNSRQSLDSNNELVKKWLFRHDKIMDFFIVQRFLENDDELLNHLSDPRFSGVYFMLAMLLPFDAAMNLREHLIQYAADTNDHIVSDRFIKHLQSREVLERLR